MGDGSRLGPGAGGRLFPSCPDEQIMVALSTVTSSAEWCCEAGTDSGRHSEGKSHGTLGCDVGEGELQGDVLVWGSRNWMRNGGVGGGESKAGSPEKHLRVEFGSHGPVSGISFLPWCGFCCR